MNITVNDRFFDITITSNSYQDIFPENTVSFFRAKLPTKLIFPRHIPYKVALGKVTFINSVNNIGSGANTKLWISNDTDNPVQVHFPELSVDDTEGFIKVLAAQLKEARPQIFKNYEGIKSFPNPVAVSLEEIGEQVQADEPQMLADDSDRNVQDEVVNVLAVQLKEARPQLFNNFEGVESIRNFVAVSPKEILEQAQSDQPQIHDINDTANDLTHKIQEYNNWNNTLFDVLFEFLKNPILPLTHFIFKWRQAYGSVTDNNHRFRDFHASIQKYGSKVFHTVRTYYIFLYNINVQYMKPAQIMLPNIDDVEVKFVTLKEYIRSQIDTFCASDEVLQNKFITFRPALKPYKDPLKLVNVLSQLSKFVNDAWKRNIDETAVPNMDLIMQEKKQELLTLYLKIQEYPSTLEPQIIRMINDYRTPEEVLNTAIDEYIEWYNMSNYVVETLHSDVASITEVESERFQRRVLNPYRKRLFRTSAEFAKFKKPIFDMFANVHETQKEAFEEWKEALFAFDQKWRDGLITNTTPPDSELSGDEVFFRNQRRRLKAIATKEEILEDPELIVPSLPVPKEEDPELIVPPPSLPVPKEEEKVLKDPELIVPKEEDPELIVPPLIFEQGEASHKRRQISSKQISVPKQPRIDESQNVINESKTNDESELVTNDIEIDEIEEIDEKEVPITPEQFKEPQVFESPIESEESVTHSLFTLLEAKRERESDWDNVNILTHPQLKPFLLFAMLPRGINEADDIDKRIFKELKTYVQIKKLPLITKRARQLTGLDETQFTLKDHMYYYVDIPYPQIYKLLETLTVKRLNWLQKAFNELETSEHVTFQNEINEITQPLQTSGNTVISVIANLFNFESTSVEFDFGANNEMLSMLGMDKHEHFQYNTFMKRIEYRQILQHLLRNLQQVNLKGAYSVLNLWRRGVNTLHHSSVSLERDINLHTQSNVHSLFSAKHLYVFKTLFMNQLDLSNYKTVIYRKYIYFLYKELQIEHPEFILGILLTSAELHNIVAKAAILSKLQILTINIKEYLKTFYKSDIGIQKRVQDPKAQLNMFLLDVDIITYLLWMCARDMPLLSPVTGTVPGKLNPMSQIWIYTNIVKESIVNNEFKRLLAMGSIAGGDVPRGHEKEISFHNPIFKHLNSTIIDDIEILIATRFGNPVPFADGPSTVQLLFEAEI